MTAGAPPAETPLVLSASDGRRMVVAAADRAALALGLAPGLPLAQAQARVPGLAVLPATPEADRAALGALAAWCLRIAPLTAPDPPDGIWIDATGAAHLHGGEAELLEHLIDRLAEDGIACRAAMADTPGAAHAVARHGARHGAEPAAIVPPGAHAAALAGLPVASLRLEAWTEAALRRLGFAHVAALEAAPRAALARRFGPLPGLRLDQAMGRVFEPIAPVFPPDIVSARRVFVEPLLTAESFAAVIADLVAEICAALERAGQGARRLDLLFERVDGAVPRIGIGTARPARAPRHLARMLTERLEQVDPGLGVEAMRLVVPLAETLPYRQSLACLGEGGDPDDDIAALVDRIENRLGRGRVYRVAPMESDVPERAARCIPALDPPRRVGWPPHLPRPVRLFDPPQAIDAMALLPDQPPAAFIWRRRRHLVRRADGPERIHGEWWRRDAELSAVRDYFAVEDADGRRFWLFRRGNGVDPATGDLSWFLHGVF
jgi:protein ImuB